MDILSNSRRTAFFSAFALCFLSVALYTYQYRPSLPVRLHIASNSGFDGIWNYERDAENLMLSDRECDSAFPGLYKEVDRAVDYRRNRPITKEELDSVPRTNGYVRAMIYNRKLYIIDIQGTFFSREYATMHAIHRALLTSTESIPNIEFTFQTDDVVNPRQAIWAYSRNATGQDLWVIPDFGFWAWPEPKVGSYSEAQYKAIAVDAATPWHTKKEQLVWRGALIDLPVREALFNETEGKPWADVHEIHWGNKTDLETYLMSMDAHCRYKYVAHTEGTSSSGRLKFLQNCRSVVVSHKLGWVQHHHHLMISSGPEQNFVEANTEWSDLDAIMVDLKSNDAKAERIADNGIKLFRERYLTPAAETCYWRKLIRGWATVSFDPEFLEMRNGVQKFRGVPVESFLLMRRMKWGRTDD